MKLFHINGYLANSLQTDFHLMLIRNYCKFKKNKLSMNSYTKLVYYFTQLLTA